MNIRNVQPNDVARICRIYNYYVENTPVTFETLPVSEEDMRERVENILKAGFPYYVIEVNGKIVGYTYLYPWKNRTAYSLTQEVTIYLDHEETGKGYGSKLYEYLFKTIDSNQTHALIAGICIPNDASVKLHEKFGFQQVSHFKEIGHKFNQWQDVGHWLLIPDTTSSLTRIL